MDEVLMIAGGVLIGWWHRGWIAIDTQPGEGRVGLAGVLILVAGVGWALTS